MIKINSEIIEEIKSRIDIVDVISEKVDLKKTGLNYKGLCPFHSEKTPSFVVSSEKQIFKCFGCGKAGDVFSFLEGIENLDFYEVVKNLALSCGIELEEKSSISKSELDKKSNLKNINILARDFFISNLKKSTLAKDYLKKRDIVDLNEFYIGYAPDSWDDLYNFLSKKNIKNSQAVTLGLIREKNGKFYDYFRNRIIFPIYNHKSELLAFGGRIIDSNNDAKYLNSPESSIYTKGDVLYGLNVSSKHIKQIGYAVVVEGYLDLLSLYQHGIKNVVATLGTSFTLNQAKLLKKHTNRVVMFYDSDTAGLNAAYKSYNILASLGLSVDALFLEDGMDPDDAVKKYSPQDLEKQLLNAGPLILKIINQKYSKALSVSEKNNVTNELIDLISILPEKLDRYTWINELSHRTKIPFKELISICDSKLNKNSKTNSKTKKLAKQKVDVLYVNLLKVLFLRPDFCIKICDENLDEYLPEELRKLVYKIKDICDVSQSIELNTWLGLSKTFDMPWLEALVCNESLNTNSQNRNLDNEFLGCMTKFKIKYFESKKNDSLSKIKDGSEKTLREFSAIVKEINNLKDFLAKVK